GRRAVRSSGGRARAQAGAGRRDQGLPRRARPRGGGPAGDRLRDDRAAAPQARQAARRAPDVAARGGSRVLGGRCLLLHGQGPRQLDFRARRAARPHVPARRRGAHGDDHGPAHGGGAGAQPAVLERVSVLREVRFLTPEDIDAAMPIRAFAFGQAMSQEHREFLERNLKYIMGTFEDGRLASVGTMWPFTAYVGGTRKGLGGLAAVATAPTARRRGH